MTKRIPWQRTDDPQRFTAPVPDGGTAEMWHQQTGPQGTAGWRWRIVIGATRDSGVGNSKQHTSDQANKALPELLAHERARLAKIAARDALHRRLDAASEAGTVDVMAFGLQTMSGGDLQAIMDYLRYTHRLEGTLAPLREAVSNEMYRRRVRPGPH